MQECLQANSQGPDQMCSSLSESQTSEQVLYYPDCAMKVWNYHQVVSLRYQGVIDKNGQEKVRG